MMSYNKYHNAENILSLFLTIIIITNLCDNFFLDVALFDSVWLNSSIAFLLGIILHSIFINKLSIKFNAYFDIKNRGIKNSIHDFFKFGSIYVCHKYISSYMDGTPVVFDRDWIMETTLLIAGYSAYNIILDPIMPNVSSYYQSLFNDVVKITLGNLTADYFTYGTITKTHIIKLFGLISSFVIFHLVVKELLCNGKSWFPPGILGLEVDGTVESFTAYIEETDLVVDKTKDDWLDIFITKLKTNHKIKQSNIDYIIQNFVNKSKKLDKLPTNNNELVYYVYNCLVKYLTRTTTTNTQSWLNEINNPIQNNIQTQYSLITDFIDIDITSLPYIEANDLVVDKNKSNWLSIFITNLNTNHKTMLLDINYIIINYINKLSIMNIAQTNDELIYIIYTYLINYLNTTSSKSWNNEISLPINNNTSDYLLITTFIDSLIDDMAFAKYDDLIVDKTDVNWLNKFITLLNQNHKTIRNNIYYIIINIVKKYKNIKNVSDNMIIYYIYNYLLNYLNNTTSKSITNEITMPITKHSQINNFVQIYINSPSFIEPIDLLVDKTNVNWLSVFISNLTNNYNEMKTNINSIIMLIKNSVNKNLPNGDHLIYYIYTCLISYLNTTKTKIWQTEIPILISNITNNDKTFVNTYIATNPYIDTSNLIVDKTNINWLSVFIINLQLYHSNINNNINYIITQIENNKDVLSKDIILPTGNNKIYYIYNCLLTYLNTTKTKIWKNEIENLIFNIKISDKTFIITFINTYINTPPYVEEKDLIVDITKSSELTTFITNLQNNYSNMYNNIIAITTILNISTLNQPNNVLYYKIYKCMINYLNTTITKKWDIEIDIPITKYNYIVKSILSINNTFDESSIPTNTPTNIPTNTPTGASTIIKTNIINNEAPDLININIKDLNTTFILKLSKYPIILTNINYLIDNFINKLNKSDKLPIGNNELKYFIYNCLLNYLNTTKTKSWNSEINMAIFNMTTKINTNYLLITKFIDNAINNLPYVELNDLIIGSVNNDSIEIFKRNLAKYSIINSDIVYIIDNYINIFNIFNKSLTIPNDNYLKYYIYTYLVNYIKTTTSKSWDYEISLIINNYKLFISELNIQTITFEEININNTSLVETDLIVNKKNTNWLITFINALKKYPIYESNIYYIIINIINRYINASARPSDNMLIYYVYMYLINYLNKTNTKLWETEINIPIKNYSLITTFIDASIKKSNNKT